MISDETYAVDVRSSGTLSITSSSRHNHKSNGFYLVLVDILDIILVLDQHLERWCLDRLGWGGLQLHTLFWLPVYMYLTLPYLY
jgi:hypothetical protein